MATQLQVDGASSVLRISPMTLLPSSPVPVIENVWPEKAAEWLALSPGNARRLKPARVDQYVRDMRNGQWVVNNDAITFDATGALTNGHHRLTAVVQSGVTVPMLVMRGLSPAAVRKTDSGVSRSYADVLLASGEVNRTALAATLTWLYRHDVKKMLNNDTISVAERDATLARHPLARDVVSVASELPKGVHIAPVMFLLTVARERAPERADEFFEFLRTGVGIDSERHPVYRLRERLRSQVGQKARLKPLELCALTIIAWNYFYVGRKEVGALKWRTEGTRPVPFPVVLPDVA